MLKEVICDSDIITPIKPIKGANSGANSVDMGPRLHRITSNSNKRRVISKKDPHGAPGRPHAMRNPPHHHQIDCARAQISRHVLPNSSAGPRGVCFMGGRGRAFNSPFSASRSHGVWPQIRVRSRLLIACVWRHLDVCIGQGLSYLEPP